MPSLDDGTKRHSAARWQLCREKGRNAAARNTTNPLRTGKNAARYSLIALDALSAMKPLVALIAMVSLVGLIPLVAIVALVAHKYVSPLILFDMENKPSIILIFNQKGGVGKSTCTMLLAKRR